MFVAVKNETYFDFMFAFIVCIIVWDKIIKGGFNAEGRGEFSQLPKMSAEKTFLGFKI